MKSKIKYKVRKGDSVIIVAGKDKGKKGEVIKVFFNDGKVLVSGVGNVKKHSKPSKINTQGGIVDKGMPIHVSNVAHIDPKTDMTTKIGYKILENGSKVRYSKRSGELIDLI